MTIKCPKCQFENPHDTLFCGKCGTQFPSSEEAGVTKTTETSNKGLTTGPAFGGRYQIIEELGKGGMGRVYRAPDRKLNEEGALKLIKPEISSDKKTLERFQNELKLARKIRHKKVGGMYEFLEDNGTYYITMEYVSGEDLKSFIRRIGLLPSGKDIAAVTNKPEFREGKTIGSLTLYLSQPHGIFDLGDTRISVSLEIQVDA